MPFDWKKLFSAAVASPLGRHVIGATLTELEQNPQYIQFVERYQRMNTRAASTGGVAQAECMICMFLKYGKEQGLTHSIPQHDCPDRKHTP